MPRNHRKPKGSGRDKTGRLNLSWLWIVLGIGVVAVAAFFLSRPAETAATEISVAQAYQKYRQGSFFLDVRSQEEWDQMHLARSVLIPLEELPNRLSEVPKDRDVVVICRSGRRSKEGMGILQQAGYSRVSCMAGGLLAWQAAGYPLEGGAP